MSIDQGEFGINHPESLGQGSFGRQQQNTQEDSWVCPNCETVNTDDACILCGYTKGKAIHLKKNQRKNIVIVLIAILAVTVGALFAIPNGWQEKNGKLYFYTWGRKNTGKQEIDGAVYFFDTYGTMQTGWHQISGDNYYFDVDGKMVTGDKTIENERCVFGMDGKLNTKTWTLPYYQIPTSRYSGEQMEYKHNNGTPGGADYWLLGSPIKNCTSITVSVKVSNYKAGNVDKWGFYVRDMAGKWSRVGTIDIHNMTGQSVFRLDAPITFDAYSFPCESLEDWWDFSYEFELSDVEVINYY